MSPETSNALEGHPPAAGHAPAFLFRVFPGREGLVRIRSEWNEVAGGLERRRFSHLLAWHEAYACDIAADPGSLRYFVAYADGAPIAVFPLASRVERIGGIPARTLGFPAHDHLEMSDLVFRQTDRTAGLVEAFVQHLRGESSERWDALVLRDVLEDSAAWFSISRAPPRRLITEPAAPCRYFERGPYEERLSRTSTAFRRNLRARRSRLAKAPEVEFVRARTEEEIRAAFDQFLAVEASGWKGARGSAIRCDARLTAFYRSVATRFAALGCGEINLLRAEGTCIAAQFCLRVDRCLYLVKIGYDERHAKLAPGNLLLEHVLKRCASERDVDSVNLVTPAPWSVPWKAEEHPRFSAYVFAETPRGRACYWTLRAKARLRPLVRRVRSVVGRGRGDAG